MNSETPRSDVGRHAAGSETPQADVGRHAAGSEDAGSESRLPRRTVLAAAATVGAGAAVCRWAMRPRSENVFIARNQRYDGDLVRTVEDGLRSIELPPEAFRGKRVLLKPNLVEPSREAPQLTTHPAVVAAAAAVFRRHGAHVVVGEAPGHIRDTEFALCESGTLEMLESERIEFADLNYEDVVEVRNRGRRSRLKSFYFPRSVASADLIVSLPKMKTHHWMGVTGALKNMYGVIPGSVYGWPKNVLHYAGIAQTVFDINASLPPVAAVVDGILCMEGDGPIMGTPKPMGLLLVGANPVAVDATLCRLMRLNPDAVPYLKLAKSRLGPVQESLILQRGEAWQELAQPFEILDEPHLRPLRQGVLIS